MTRLTWKDYRNRILAEIDNEAFFMSELKNIHRRGSELKRNVRLKTYTQTKQTTPPL